MHACQTEKARRWRAAGVFAALLCLALLGAAFADPSTNDTSKQGTNMDLIKAQGTLIAQGTNKEPVGPLALKGYKIEKIALPKAIDVEVKGQMKRVNTAYRVTVNGGPFPVRALIPIMCINGVSIPASEKEDLTALIGITYDESLVRSGATIAVGYGNPDAPCDSTLDSFSVLPEKLNLGKSR